MAKAKGTKAKGSTPLRQFRNAHTGRIHEADHIWAPVYADRLDMIEVTTKQTEEESDDDEGTE